jgi:hypothetical protein
MQYLSGTSSIILAIYMVWLSLKKHGNNQWLWAMFTAGALSYVALEQLAFAIIKTINHG